MTVLRGKRTALTPKRVYRKYAATAAGRRSSPPTPAPQV